MARYCKHCYAPLPDPADEGDKPKPVESIVTGETHLDYASPKIEVPEGNWCLKCGRKFDPKRPWSFVTRPYPSNLEIASTLLLTTLFGIAAAWVVTFHQYAAMSGH